MTLAETVAEVETWQDWPLEQKIRLRMVLRRRALANKAREDQLPPQEPWQKFLMTGGRGSGKSWAGAKAFADEILSDPERTKGAWAIVAPTFADARDKCVESDESGVLVALGTSLREVNARSSAIVEKWNRSIGEIVFHDGTRIVIDGADDGAYRIQGENLRGVWADEVGLWKKWKTAWDESITFALRLGRSRIIATGTPKRSLPARALVKRLLADPKCVHRRLLTADNWDNLSEAFKDAVRPYVGTTLGAQELEGKMLEDAEGALWHRWWIDLTRAEEGFVPHAGWQRPPMIGCDPSDGTEDGAEHAYTVSALGMDHQLYVVESEGMRCSPTAFARETILVAARYHGVLVLEKNHGGQWLVDTYRRAMKDLKVNVPLKVVSASQSKRTRAEPVAGLYEPREIGGETIPGRVRHVGVHELLEDQMCNWTGAPGEQSPDRLDSLVWSLVPFMEASFAPPPVDAGTSIPYADAPAVAGGAVGWSAPDSYAAVSWS